MIDLIIILTVSYFVVTINDYEVLFILQSLRVSLLNGEDANAVETDREQGYGPIHYIVTGRHKSKRELLLELLVYGKAKLDLITTQHGITALQLAVEVR